MSQKMRYGTDNDFLKILVCPVTHQSLRLLGSLELDALNASISRGEVAFSDGRVVSAGIRSGLVTTDGVRVYAVVDETPILLEDEAICLREPLDV